ncbi:MAG: right-handed parallel beta-helix repeat-containing protein, partial [Planctomycetota bacterium]
MTVKKLTLAWTCLLLAIPCSADIIYVKQGGTGAGSNWADPNGVLQIAINNADTDDEVWVAAGTYYPTELNDPCNPHDLRTASFQMKNGVAIYGGFPNTGNPDMSDRDPNMYETILSGDLLGNDNPDTPVEDLLGDPCRSDNSYHVFYHPKINSLRPPNPAIIPCPTPILDPTAILDGFTITSGNANANGSRCHGGGIYNGFSNITVNNCTFTGNSALDGGGMFNFSSNPTVTNCTFSSNSAYLGGGMCNLGSSPTVTKCTFTGNSAEHGGGMNNDYSDPTVVVCTFSSNSAYLGGGMRNFESSPTVTKCTFTGNSGGGMDNRENSSPSVTNCTFTGNSVDDAYGCGGGMSNSGGSPTVTGCIFTGNSADGAHGYGGGMYNRANSSLTMSNCILWGNTAFSGGNEIALSSLTISSTINVAYCDVQGGQAGIYGDIGGNTINWGSGNIDTDPLFVDADGPDGIVGTEDDNLRLSANSPCIDTGDSTAVTVEHDLDGQPRIMDGDDNSEAAVDMGAYEYYGSAYEPTLIYVNANAIDGNNNGSSWEDAFTSFQEGLDSAIIGDQIWVAAGTYTPDPCGLVDPREASFQMKNYVAIYGGFGATGNPDMTDRDPDLFITILSGDLLNNDNPDTPIENLYDDPSRDDNSYHVFYNPISTNLGTTAILDGFTITSGNADGFYPHYYGGGMFNENISPTVANCIFAGNSAYFGGGMDNIGHSNPTVTNCTFTGNLSSGMCNQGSPTVINCIFTGNFGDDGGGMRNLRDSRPTVTNCTFTGNSAYFGGGMYNRANSSPIVTGCTFTGNSVIYEGGGMNNEYSNPTVVGCTFSGNSAEDGGGIYNIGFYSTSTVTGCTFTGNIASNGNAIACDSYKQSSPSTLNITNSILRDGGDEIYNNDGSTITISYSDVDGGWEGEGNIDADPMFVKPGYWDPNGTLENTNDDFWVEGDYRLLPGSPCVDAGDPDYIAGPDDVGLDGNPRIIHGKIDMGAFEYWKYAPNPADLNGDGAVDY